MTGAIDYDHLAQYTGGDSELEAEVFALFINQIESWSRLLEPDAADEDWAAAAHSLKGSARGVGAVELAEACAKAETLIGAAGEAARRSVAREKILSRMDQVKDEIAERDYRRVFSELRSAS